MTKGLPTNCRLIVLCASLVALSAPLLSAQDRSRYRDYRIGDNLRSISEQSGAALPMARIIPREPAVLQELEWRPQYFRGAPRQSDAVARVTFGFYDDQLFRIVVDYERFRTEGMTEADMVGAISETYGPPSRRAEPTPSFAEQHSEQDADLLVACWEDTEYSVTLLRVPNSSAFRLVVASTRLGALAEVAGAGAVRLDSHEALQRDVPARISDAEDVQSAQQKARLANKAVFKP
jgi:hypothetical protein